MTAGNLLRLGLLGLLLALVLQPNWFTPLFTPLAPAGGPVIYARSSLLSLSLSHLGLVALASVAATLVAVTLAIFVTRPVGAHDHQHRSDLSPRRRVGAGRARLGLRVGADAGGAFPLWPAADI